MIAWQSRGYTITTKPVYIGWWNLFTPNLWGERETIPSATLSPPQWLLYWDRQRWELFSCYINCEGKSHKTVSTKHNFWREGRAEAESNRDPSAYHPKALPLGQTGWLYSSKMNWPAYEEAEERRVAASFYRYATMSMTPAWGTGCHWISLCAQA